MLGCAALADHGRALGALSAALAVILRHRARRTAWRLNRPRRSAAPIVPARGARSVCRPLLTPHLQAQCSAGEECALAGALRGVCSPGSMRGQLPIRAPALAVFGTTPACHPGAGTCVSCSRDEHCGGAATACDRGRGQCAAPVADVCSPCSGPQDCGAVDGGAPELGCVALTNPAEQVCLRTACTADVDCPTAFECLPSLASAFPSWQLHRVSRGGRPA